MLIFVASTKISMKKNDWKDRLGILYSTNPDVHYETNEEVEAEGEAGAAYRLG